jgi:23S rRNA (uracil1939-C5)-methyltransferase
MSPKCKQPQLVTTTIDKLVFGGQGLGHFGDRTVFAWDALPGEEVELLVTKKHKGIIEGISQTIHNPSPHRIPPREQHFLSCSPWQIMDYAYEQEWKIAMAREAYQHIGKLSDMELQGLELVDTGNQYSYRNKMEFSFAADEDDKISLAFFERGSKWRYAIDGCCLAEPCINQTARYVLDWINEVKIPIRSLKSLIIRSNGASETIAALFIKDELTFAHYPKLEEINSTITSFLKGMSIFYSTHKTPASRPDKLLYRDGQDYLTADINGIRLKFGLLSFFQINIPVFRQALADIASLLEPSTCLVDFYSGVGAISLPLASQLTSCTLVDNNAEAIQYAQENISINQLAHCQAKLAAAEDALELITKDAVVVCDPPRAGLHPDVIKKLLAEQPRRIMYLSCNVATQARDIALLHKAYTVSSLKLYNLFPRTPHIEGLVILRRTCSQE